MNLPVQDSSLRTIFQKGAIIHPSPAAALLFISAWVGTRAIDFGTGFAPFSWFRLLVSVILLPAFLLLNPAALMRRRGTGGELPDTTETVPVTSWSGACLAVAVLAFLGYLIFFTRYQRGAHMGDDDIFRQSIESTAAFTGLLYNETEGGSHFAAHNSPFLILLVPLVWVFRKYSWYVIHYIHSVAIVLWAYVLGRSAAATLNRPGLVWPVTVGFFLATYGQHAVFYEAHFAALGVDLCVVGLLEKKPVKIFVGLVIALITRESAVLSLMLVFIFFSRRALGIRTRVCLIGICAAWLALTMGIWRMFGGPLPQEDKFDSCLGKTSFSVKYAECVFTNLSINWPLKLGFVARMLSFGPLAMLSKEALAGVVPLALMVALNRNGIMHSLGWHYYMADLGIVFLFGVALLGRWVSSRSTHDLYVRFILATCLWQFLTTVRADLF